MAISDLVSDDAAAFYRRGLLIRAVAAASFLCLFAAFTVLRPQAEISGLGGASAVLAFLLLVNPLLWWVGQRRGFPVSDFYVHWLMDVAAVTLVAHFLGGGEVPIVAAAYMVMIVSSATFSTWRTSWGLACVAAVTYGAVLYLEHVGVVTHYHIGPGEHAATEAELISAWGAILFFFVFAYLAGTLANQLRERSDKIAAQKVELEESLRSEQASREGLVTLSTIVQHDVYSPLGVTAGACKEALRECGRGNMAEVQRWLEEIQERLGSIESAVGSLSACGEDQEGTEANVDAYEVASQAVVDLGAEWKTKGVSIELDGLWPIVSVPRPSLYHVFRNLLANAIRSVPENGQGSVVVESRRGQKMRWEFEVCDNGPGLPEEVRARLGEPTQRRVRLKKRATGSFGAGLTLVQILARNWGGGLSCESPVVGTSILVWVPRDKVVDPALR